MGREVQRAVAFRSTPAPAGIPAIPVSWG